MKKLLMVRSELDNKIMELASETDKKTLVIWACECVERVLPYFEQLYPDDKRPKTAIETAREWAIDGIFKMSDVRTASLDSHAAARQVDEYDPARSVARAAGQAVAATHAKGHAVVAAIYAATAVRDINDELTADTEVFKERSWQYSHLSEMMLS
jgi:Immunity protein Imm5